MAELLTQLQATRPIVRWTAAAAASLLIAGCQVIPRGDRPAPPPPPEAPPPAPEPSPTPIPTDDARNRVAVLVPLTGSNAGVGRSLANAANLALLDTGDTSIRITVYDTAKGAAAAANDALAAGNGLFLGPLLAEDVQAVAPIARRGNVPVISFSNDVSVAGNGVYVMGFNPRQSIDRVVDYARSRGIQRFAGLAPDGAYGRRSSQALIDAANRGGGRVTAMETYAGSAAALRSAATRLNTAGDFDAVLIADTGRSAIAAAPLLKRGGSSGARILGTELWKTETGLSREPALRGAWFATVSDTLFDQLRQRYRARYGVAPYRLASLGYDATLLAVRIGREWRLGTRFPADELRNPEGFMGIDGTFRFDRDGVADRMLEVQEVGASGTTVVSPAPQSFQR